MGGWKGYHPRLAKEGKIEVKEHSQQQKSSNTFSSKERTKKKKKDGARER